MKAAVIENGVVDNIIEVESLDILPGLIDADGANIGDLWDGAKFSSPPVLPGAVMRYMTVFAFRNRFTKTEKIRIELAAIDNPSSTSAERERAAMVRVGQADLAAATYVDVARIDTRVDVEAFEDMGLLDSPGRAMKILDEEIQEHERYNG